MDDLHFGSDTIEEHLVMLREVLTRLRVTGLKLKLAKCDFLKKKAIYLRHVISEQGGHGNLQKNKGIAKFPELKNKKNIKQFLGLAVFFRKFVKGRSIKAAPLTDAVKDDVQFRWGEKEQLVFDNLKAALGQPPVLQFPNFQLPIILVTDASELGMETCVMQKGEKVIHPIVFFLQEMDPDETKMSTIDKEAYTLNVSLLYFRYLIFGYKILQIII